MSFEIGTATDHYDLQQKIKTFVTATLPLAERHILLRDVAEGTGVGDGLNFWTMIFKAPGLSTTDEVYYGIKTYQSVTSDYYNFQINGFTGYVPGNTFETQPGGALGLTSGLGVTLWNQPIPYWLVADGDGFVCVAKVQNTYVTFGAGLAYKYATKSQYPYPLLVHGNLTTAAAIRYSDTAQTNGWKGNRGNLRLRFVDGTWKTPEVLAYQNSDVIRNTNSNSNIADGYYGLHPLELSSPVGFGEIYGRVPYLYFISGFNNTVENTLTLSGTTYVVIRDGVRTGFADYMALKLG